MSSRTRFLSLIVSLFPVCSACGAIEDWFVDKAITYRQSADDSQPSAASGWTIEVAVATTDPGDIGSASISRVGSTVSHSLVFEDGEWIFEKDYQNEAALNAEFPSNSNYTITVGGGTLGPLIQTFTLGAADYPEAPYLVGSDYTRVQSIDSESGFVFHWNAAGSFGNAVSLEVSERQTDLEAVSFEAEGSPLPETRTVTAGTLNPGRCYEGYLSFLNSTEASGTGGFGVEGFIEHSSNLSFEIQTVLSPSVEAIVGAWQFGDGASDASGVLVFQANGVYFHAEDIPDGTSGDSDGMERGTYTWDENSGQFTAAVQVDTNGTIGLSNPNGTFNVTVDGDSLTISDGDATVLERVAFDASAWIEGGWRICDNDGSNTGILVFLENGIYFHAEVDGGTSGMERGTYTWDSGTGALNASPIVDTNGTMGLSHPAGAFVANIPGPRIMNISDGDPTDLHRVTNAGVMPDWRLNKARSYNQSADNTAPTSAVFWDIYSLVETRNATDASSVTLSGGGLPAPLQFAQDDPGEWTYEKDYADEASLDSEFADNQVFTITVSGGELGTLSQEINIGGKSFPGIPFLVGTVFSDIQSIDPTIDFEVEWNTPTNNTAVSFAVTSLPNEDGVEIFDELLPGGSDTGTALPAQSLAAGFQAYGYLEFSNFLVASTGAGGFGVSGFSSRQSITQDFPVNAKTSSELVSKAAEDAGLTGPDAEPDAIPFDDGVKNLLKYAFNMDLGGPDVSTLASGSGNSGLPASKLEEGDAGLEFKVEFVRRKGSGLVYTAESSTTLLPSSFSDMDGTVTVTPIGTDGKFERVVVSEQCDPSTTPKCFGRVEVSGM